MPNQQYKMIVRFLSISALLVATTAFAPSLKNVLSKSVVGESPHFEKECLSLSQQRTLNTELNAVMTQAELPEKLYFGKEKESPKILGGIKIGLRKLVVITGASSGLGLNCATTLAKTGRYFVVMAVRDPEKAKRGT